MLLKFPLGEELWYDWISDEMALARTIEERIGVMELCQRAVVEEVGSVTLWLSYGNWVLRLYHASHPRESNELNELLSRLGLEEDPAWSDEDRAVAVELFDWNMMFDVWKQGCRATEWRISDSHLIWDMLLELACADVPRGPHAQKVGQVRSLFGDRLRMPHATWDQTFQMYSTFMSTYSNAVYEESMVAVNKSAKDAKDKYAARESFELQIKRAKDSQKDVEEWTAYTEYLEWEVSHVRKKDGSHHLCNALFERAVLRYGTVATLWEDYVFYILDLPPTQDGLVSTLAVLNRATRLCPWAGTLWAQYLLRAESEEKPFHEVEEVKHKATSTGLMESGELDELLKVYTVWCGYLNRRAFHDRATDEEADVAEVGILSAIEIVKELGEKKHGKAYNGDPNYRLERIYVEYLSRSGQWNRAHDTWKTLVGARGDSYEFWLRWYHWEMMHWFSLGGGTTVANNVRTPASALAVLRQAVTRHNLDWPEKIIEVYMDHVRDFETVQTQQAAMVLARKISKSVTKRRQREAVQALEMQQQQLQKQEPKQQELDLDMDVCTGPGKRKREGGAEETDGQTAKKSRAQHTAVEAERSAAHAEPATGAPLKRDRENSTVIVKNLPAGVSETKVRQFFRDCGKINSVKLLPEADGGSVTATVEFETSEDVLAAQTRDMKVFEGQAIEVQVGVGTTVYVTNFPRVADEAYIRRLFEEYGTMVDVRFPSLKFNTHRRFCYVQFASSRQARKAIELDGEDVGDDQLKLVVKMSDPSHKQGRTGPLYEGRELHVSNVDWGATEEEVRGIFSKYGRVEKVRIPRNQAGKSKGIAFVVFASPEAATAALDVHLTKFKSRILNVSLATADAAKRPVTSVAPSGHQAADSGNTHSATAGSPSALPDGAEDGTGSGAHANGASDAHAHVHARPSDAAAAAATPASDDAAHAGHVTRESIQARTLALLHVPDTINDARLRVLAAVHGTLVKVVLRPDHQGAIVEFAAAQAAGRAALALEGFEILPGRRIGVGRVADLWREKAELKRGSGAGGGGTREKKRVPSSGLMPQPSSGVIKRPAARGARGGRRGGGLGLKTRGGGGGDERDGGGRAATPAAGTRAEAAAEAAAGATAEAEADHRPGEATEAADQRPPDRGPHPDATSPRPPPAAATAAPKTNADFQALFLKRT
ncbi:MAG: Splicing factor [Phylliscum demangeonii]|nr:MAG: Splicing factor [Phylliscum demangeonii]